MAGTSLQLYTVDAFTDVPFKGNPAAVCPLSSDLDLSDDILQKIAVEMNLSETAFIKPLNKTDTFKDGDTFGLRWFTPKAEVKLCGHATLTSAAVLFGKIGNNNSRIVFKTLSGDLIVKKEGEFLHMDFPVGLTVKESQSQHGSLIKSLGNIPGLSDIVYCESLRYLLVRLQDGWSSETVFGTRRGDLVEVKRRSCGTARKSCLCHGRILPNAEHSCAGHEISLLFTMRAFFMSLMENYPLSKFSWVRELTPTGAKITVTAETDPLTITCLWAKTIGGESRDFRLLVGTPGDPEKPFPHPVVWHSEPVQYLGNRTYMVEFDNPDVGWRAFFIQLTFRGARNSVFEFTTENQIIPDTFPFPDCSGADCMGTLV